ncbi:hypothetical protein HXA31_20310 [Salipaludibacillus agaradhaerens]|jgi:uncharacterized protein YdeI (YjbR/CyaY-like superfamily)|uniref:Uncharacterized protein n=1 Tax=Salipaludibacillus agaradhaerens TaxID=76935 RepID=A0A9Q4B2G2_SALAG|nr:hypothetical protein [Salipaludibacillus agaradhaerens]MCR6096905.1 hypothetical protein [Salipaludibacillus agaradhaerens]MCR6116675.1 hypothetical protein [Salipaludibacillus agaradhaerens]
MYYNQSEAKQEYNNTLNKIATLAARFKELERENRELKDTLNEHTKLSITQAQRIETLENIIRRCGYDPRD